MIPSINRSWFAIRTKSRQEMIASDQLQNQGFEVYLPLVYMRISHARKVSWQLRPFFVSYLFMHLAKEEQRWATIRSTIGVLAPVSFGTFYPPLPDAAIELLQSQHDEQGIIVSGEMRTPQSLFKASEEIRILDGPLNGLEGVFVEMRGEDRALVLLDWMQKKMRVITETANLVSKA